MRTAFHAPWQSLVDGGSLLASDGQAERIRGTLAQYIIDAAQAGEIDADKLRDDALAFLANVSGRKEA
jgi:hypothetical protein